MTDPRSPLDSFDSFESLPSIDPVMDALALRGHGAQAPVDRTIRLNPTAHDEPDEDSRPRAEVRAALEPAASPRRSIGVGELAPLDEGSAGLAVGKLLGQGGAGSVHEAWQPSLERSVAIKRIRRRPVTEDLVSALVEEARLAGSLEHPNILPVHELGRDGPGHPVIVMQKVQGTTWSDLLASPHHPSWERWRGDRLERHIQILIQVCRAVEFAHAHGILHLDVKPENVMLGDFGEVWLMDWGVATRLADMDSLPRGQVVGTPAFMAPEMLVGRNCTEERTDQFLLGAVLQSVLTGKLPYSGDRIETVLRKVLMCEEPPLPAGTPAELVSIVRKARAKHLTDRYADVATFRMALEDFLEHRGAQRVIDTANHRLEELERVLGQAAGDAAALGRSAASIANLSSRARFGFEQALTLWPASAEARDGLQRVLVATIGFELDRENVSAVGPLIDALPDPEPELTARYAKAKAALDDALDARARLHELREETRFEAADWSRSIGMLVNGTLWAVALLAWGRAVRTGAIADPEGFNLLVALIGTTVSLTVVAVLRRLFLDNQVRRGFTAAYLVFIVALDLNRIAALFLDIPFTHTLMADHAVLIMFMGVLAAFVAPTLWAAAGVAIAAMMATMLWPDMQFGIAALDLAVVNAIVGWALRPRSAGGKFA